MKSGTKGRPVRGRRGRGRLGLRGRALRGVECLERRALLAALPFGAALEEARHDPEFPDRLAGIFERMWDLPGWFGTWAILFGIAGLLVTGFYLLTSIWLLQVKPAADKLMIAALLISIILAAIQAITAVMVGGFVAILFVAGGVFSIIIDLVLLIVILTSDRGIFLHNAAAARM